MAIGVNGFTAQPENKTQNVYYKNAPAFTGKIKTKVLHDLKQFFKRVIRVVDAHPPVDGR
jgi:hypothetical protein